MIFLPRWHKLTAGTERARKAARKKVGRFIIETEGLIPGLHIEILNEGRVIVSMKK